MGRSFGGGRHVSHYRGRRGGGGGGGGREIGGSWASRGLKQWGSSGGVLEGVLSLRLCRGLSWLQTEC